MLKYRREDKHDYNDNDDDICEHHHNERKRKTNPIVPNQNRKITKTKKD